MKRIIAYLRAHFYRKPPVPAGAADLLTASNGVAHCAPEDEYAI